MLASAIMRAWEKHGEVPFDLYQHEAEKMAAEVMLATPLHILVCEWLYVRLAAIVKPPPVGKYVAAEGSPGEIEVD